MTARSQTCGLSRAFICLFTPTSLHRSVCVGVCMYESACAMQVHVAYDREKLHVWSIAVPYTYP